MSEAALPIISYAKLAAGDVEEIDRLRQVTHKIGFFYLTDHGVDEKLRNTVIAKSKEFFALPLEQKNEISNLNNRHYRGYSSLGDERTQNKVDWREQLDYSFDLPAHDEAEYAQRPWRVVEGPNPWPAQVPELKDAVNGYIQHLTGISQNIIRAWSKALGQDEGVFDEQFAHPFPLLKLVRYPAVEHNEATQGVGAHKDSGVITLLYIEPDSSGLQVETDNGWIDVQPIVNTYVVNIGELLESATDGYLVATRHRVLPTAKGSERYSFPFFLTPNLDTTLPTLELPEAYRAESRGVGQDMQGQQIYGNSGLNTLKSRIRAHPETTAKFNQSIADQFQEL